LFHIPSEKQAYAWPMSSLNTQTNRPSDDLDAVLGRFQAWTIMQTQTPTQTKTPKEDGVSEISYEQALRATARYHRTEAPVEPPIQNSVRSVHTVASEPASAAELPKVQPAAPVYKKQPARKAQRASTRTTAAAIETASPMRKSQQKQKRDSFAQVLKQETGLARVETGNLRSSALTVRLAPDESALIKARADEAQLSTSAYLRQCALEIESLRAQVKETLAQMRPSVTVTAPVQVPVLPPVAGPAKPGLFGGIRLWLIRRLGGQQISTVC
jgi:hypothetical protein